MWVLIRHEAHEGHEFQSRVWLIVLKSVSQVPDFFRAGQRDRSGSKFLDIGVAMRVLRAVLLSGGSRLLL